MVQNVNYNLYQEEIFVVFHESQIFFFCKYTENPGIGAQMGTEKHTGDPKTALVLTGHMKHFSAPYPGDAAAGRNTSGGDPPRSFPFYWDGNAPALYLRLRKGSFLLMDMLTYW